MKTIGIVGCVKGKLHRPAPARDLYTSQLFKAASAYCERTYDRWLILSARYGLIEPDQIIPPYEQTLVTMSPDERRHWAYEVAESGLGRQLAAIEEAGGSVFLHAGSLYRAAFSTPGLNIKIYVPLQGQGIGQQLAWYAARVATPTTSRTEA